MSAPTASANGAASEAPNNTSSVSGVLEGVKTELKNKEFVQHRVDNVIKTAHDLRSRLEGSSSVLKYGFQAFDKSTSWVTTPLSNKLSQIAPPVLQGIDNGLATAYTTLDDKVIQPTAKLQDNESVQRLQKSATEIRQQLVSSQWFQYVDTLLHKSTATAASAASGSSAAASTAASANFAQFYALASESFVSVRQKAGDYSAFLNDLKGKMASTWDERIQGPARLFYTHALEKLRQSSNGSPASPSPPPAENIDGEVPSKSTTARFEEIFSGIRRSVAEVWAENFITTNAKALYNASLQHYLSSEPHTSPRAYVNGMKERIGKEWHDRLALPLEEFFRNARQYAVEDLQKVKSFLHLEVEDPKDVTVGELVAVPGTVVQEVRGLIHRSWDYGLSLSQSSVDYILPEVRQQQEEEKSEEAREGKSAPQESKPSLYSLSGRVAQRLKQRAAYRWQQLRQLSSTRVKNVLHVDPLSVAEQKVQDTQEKLVRPAWTSLHHSFSHVASSSQDQLARLHAASKQQLTRLTSSTAPYTSFLFSRVHSTIEFAQNSAQTPLRYVSEAVKKRSQPVLRTLSYDVDRLRTEALDLASFSARQVKAQRVLSLPYASAVFAAQLLGLSQRDEHSKQFLSQVRSVFSAAVGVVTLSPIPASAPNSPAGAPAAEQPAVSPAPSPAPSPSQEEHISNSVPSSPAPAKANGVKPHADADAAKEASPSSSPQPLATPPIPDARSVSKPVDKEVEVKPAVVESKKVEAPKAVEEEVPETEVEESSKDESAPEESTANPEKKQTATSAASKSKKRNNKKNQAK